MAISYERFVELTGCEVVAGNLISGTQSGRKLLGTNIDGTFELTEEGQAALAKLEEAPEPAEKPVSRRKKAEEPVATPSLAEPKED